MFLQAHDPELTDEDERLDHMDMATKEWWDNMQAKGGRDPVMYFYTNSILNLYHFGDENIKSSSLEIL